MFIFFVNKNEIKEVANSNQNETFNKEEVKESDNTSKDESVIENEDNQVPKEPNNDVNENNTIPPAESKDSQAQKEPDNSNKDNSNISLPVEDNKETVKEPIEKDNYIYDFISVKIIKERTILNKEYTADEFPEIQIKLIKKTDSSIISPDNDWLDVYLEVPTKENALSAIEKLKNNPIVEKAELVGNMSIY